MRDGENDQQQRVSEQQAVLVQQKSKDRPNATIQLSRILLKIENNLAASLHVTIFSPFSLGCKRLRKLLESERKFRVTFLEVWNWNGEKTTA